MGDPSGGRSNSIGSGCARLGSGVAPSLGLVKEEVAVLITLVRRHRRAVGAAVRRAVDDEISSAIKERSAAREFVRIRTRLVHVYKLSPRKRCSLGEEPAMA